MVQKLPTGVCPLLFRDKVHESVQALTLDKPSIRGWCVSLLTFALFTKFLLQLSKKAGTLLLSKQPAVGARDQAEIWAGSLILSSHPACPCWGSQPGTLVPLRYMLWKFVSYLTMASSGVERALCPFMLCFLRDSFLCYFMIRSGAATLNSQWRLAECSSLAAQCFLKGTHTRKRSLWNNSWTLSRGTLAKCANTLLSSNTWTHFLSFFSARAGFNKPSGDRFLGGRGGWMMGMRLKQYLSVSIISTGIEWLIILLFQWKLQTETQEKNMEMTFLELSSKRRNFKLQEWMQSLWKRKERGTER